MKSLWLDRSSPMGSDDLEDVSYDEVVIGAGLTGLVTALLLARAGRRVVVLEASTVGSGTTGHSTAKLSLLQGTKLSKMLERQSQRVAQAYVDANREGQAWLLRFCGDHSVELQIRDAVTYAPDDAALPDARREHEAANLLGLSTRWQTELDAPFPHRGGTVLEGQAQFDPMDVVAALVEQIRAHAGRVTESARVTGVSKGARLRVRLSRGEVVRGEHVILATGTPTLDRGLYFVKLEAHRSYALAFEHPDPPSAMFLSAGPMTRSIRDTPAVMGARQLLVGGEGHQVGRTKSEAQHLDRLRAWTSEHFPDAVESHAWSAQDYTSPDGIPYVGRMPRGGGRIFLATGYDKWGMANAAAAGLNLSAQLLGHQPSWARPMDDRMIGPRGAAHLAVTNAATGLAATRALAAGLLRRSPPDPPPEGVGTVGRDPVLPIGVSSADGQVCSVVAICTHLGGTLKWNDAEKSWDCPLHGSRFTAAGTVIEGPASRPLTNRGAWGPRFGRRRDEH